MIEEKENEAEEEKDNDDDDVDDDDWLWIHNSSTFHSIIQHMAEQSTRRPVDLHEENAA